MVETIRPTEQNGLHDLKTEAIEAMQLFGPYDTQKAFSDNILTHITGMNPGIQPSRGNTLWVLRPTYRQPTRTQDVMLRPNDATVDDSYAIRTFTDHQLVLPVLHHSGITIPGNNMTLDLWKDISNRYLRDFMMWHDTYLGRSPYTR